jgi:hypothetical protein
MAAQGAMSWHLLRNDRIVLGSFGDRLQSLAAKPPALYRCGAVLGPQMIKAIMRSERTPQICTAEVI